jgi:hypothetical protein
MLGLVLCCLLAVGGVVAAGTEHGDGLDGSVFDYVVVGGGTSGLVVANRLTEDRESEFSPSGSYFLGLRKGLTLCALHSDCPRDRAGLL